MTDRGFSMQGLLDENSALRDENRRLNNELTNSYKVNAKAKFAGYHYFRGLYLTINA